MKNNYFMLVFIIVFVFLFGLCSEWDMESLNLNKSNENSNLLEKYNITNWAGMWNDYMPGGGWKKTSKGERASIFCITFDSPDKLPSMEVFVTIITSRITIRPVLEEIYGGKGTYGNLYRKDYRPKKGIRLNDGEEYTLEIIVKIGGEHQIIKFENKIVGVTY